ncbi:MAG: 16S rRNA (guanine(966)-N(2))-methyltransferase RsmD [Gammaproteobacteria bacterium]
MARNPTPGTARIIGGRWRRRRIPIASRPGLRPSPDRVRETLFNWLQPVIAGSRCLDLFAGSGALGIESASRGACEVVMVDIDPATVEGLQRITAALGADTLSIHCVEALDFLARPSAARFDIVFLDPPYAARLWVPCCARLSAGGWLSPHARIYIECPRGHNPALPQGWTVLREAHAGQVGFLLAQAPATTIDT